MRIWFSGPRVFGIRTGVSLGSEDWAKLSRGTQSKPVNTGSFLYVIESEHGRVKIGVTTNPSARLRQLQTGSPFPVRYSYIAVTPGTGYDIERAAHAVLARYQSSGEWFDVASNVAVAVLNAAAHRLGQPLQPLTQAMADEVLRIAAQAGASTTTTEPWLSRHLSLIVAAVLFFIIAALLAALTSA